MSNGATFVRALAMGALQFCSYVPTARLPPLSSYLADPKAPLVMIGGEETQACPTLAAGTHPSNVIISSIFELEERKLVI